jgi:hypothetical protein
MLHFRFNNEKNDKLISERSISFLEIIDAINAGNAIKTGVHPNKNKYPDQKVFYVFLRDEIYVVPYVREPDGSFFLKTIFPSRKARKKLIGSFKS